MANSGWLSTLIGVPQLLDDGDEVKQRSVWNLIGATAVDNIAEERTDITFPAADGGAGFAVADLTELRAVAAAARIDRQARYVVSKKRFYAFLETPGAGVADDGEDVILPDDLVLGSAGRWYSAPQIATESLAGLLTATEKVRIRYGYGGVLRAYYAVSTNVANLASFTASQDGVDGTAGKRVFLFGQSSPNENGIYVLGTVGGGGTCALTRATDMAVGAELLYGTRVVVDQGAQWAGYEFELTSTGPCTVGSNELIFEETHARSDHAKIETLYEIGGTPVLPGNQKAAEIQAILDGGGIAVLQPGGTYYLEAQIVVDESHSGLGIVCPNGVARVVASTTPGVGLADTRTNALIRIAGTLLTGVMSTTLTSTAAGGRAYYGGGVEHLSVTSSGTFAADGYFLVGGHDFVGDNYGGDAGDAVQTCEILQASAVAANDITLKWRTKIHHSVASSRPGTADVLPYVKAVAPVIDFQLSGLAFEATTHACAVSADYCIGLEVTRCTATGFSRSPIDIFGCLNTEVIDFGLLGNNNGGVLITASHVTTVRRVRNIGGTRYHANGLHRAEVFAEFGSTNLRVGDCHFSHCVQGVSLRGCRYFLVTGCTFEDLDLTAQAVDGYHITLRGVAIDTGGGEGDYDEYSGPGIVSDCRIVNARGVATSDDDINDINEGAIVAHDTFDLRIANIDVDIGESANSTLDGVAYVALGVITQDVGLHMSNVRVSGPQHGFVIRGTGHRRVRLIACEHKISPGTGTNASVSLLLHEGTPDLEVQDCEFQGYIWFDTNYGTGADPYGPTFTGILRGGDGIVQGPLRVALNTTGGTVVHGDIVAADTTSASGTRKVVLASSSSKAIYQVVGRYGLSGYPNNGYCLVKELPGDWAELTVVGATALGDAINWTPGALTCTPSSSPTVYTIGQALSVKGAGTALVKVGNYPRLAVSTATADTIAARGSSGELVAAWHAPSGTVAASGLIRAANNTTVMAARNAANDADIVMIRVNGSNEQTFGADSTFQTYVAGQSVTLTGQQYVIAVAPSGFYVSCSGYVLVITSSDADFSIPVKTNTVNEHTAASGVTIDGFKIKDNGPDLDKWRQHIISIDVDDGAAGTPIPELIAGIPAYACTVVRAVFVARDNVTGDNTNTATLKVWRRNGSGTQAAVASLALTTGINMTAFVAKDIGAITNAAIAADECVTVEVTKAAAGLRIRGTFTITVTTDR